MAAICEVVDVAEPKMRFGYDTGGREIFQDRTVGVARLFRFAGVEKIERLRRRLIRGARRSG